MMKKTSLLFIFLTACGATTCTQSPQIKAPTVTVYNLNRPPELGTTDNGQKVHLGGFSGLIYRGKDARGKHRFMTLTDRGPNAEMNDAGNERPFVLADYQPKLISILLDEVKKEIQIERQVPLFDEKGRRLTGLPNSEEDEKPIDLLGRRLKLDPFGLDMEGITVGRNGDFWVADEYRPSICRFTADGKLKKRFVPANGKNKFFGLETFPEEISERQLNKGFEGIAAQDGKIFSILQSPLAADKANVKKARNIRLLVLNEDSGKLEASYIYVLENTNADKIGDLHALPRTGQFIAIERDGKSRANSFKKIFKFDVSQATNLLELPLAIRKKIDSMSENQLAALSIRPARKTLLIDLAKYGVHRDKLEGLAVIDARTIAVINDNDFALAGGLDTSTGRLEMNDETSQLFVIGLPEPLW